jgi:predicted RNA-binding Zn-ribbon protein involved in translation (DUF1610 family)
MQCLQLWEGAWMNQTPRLSDEPFCSNCGYKLKGLTESSKCPECGKPIVEVLMRNSHFAYRGKRWRSRARLWGYPVVDIATGPSGAEMRGHAKGIIAIGDIATGGIAIGGIARGIVAIGGVAMGAFTIGGVSIGVLMGLGGCATGAIVLGGFAVGLFALGGGSVGLFASGGGPIGLYTCGPRGYDSAKARELLTALTIPLICTIVLPLLTAALIAIPALLAGSRDGWKQDDSES